MFIETPHGFACFIITVPVFLGSDLEIIKAENIIDHEDQTRPFETDALSAYKQQPLAVVFPENTKEVSKFGSVACQSFYTCNDCKEPFNYFKCL